MADEYDIATSTSLSVIFLGNQLTGEIVCPNFLARPAKPLLPSGPIGVRTKFSEFLCANDPERERGELSRKLPVRDLGGPSKSIACL